MRPALLHVGSHVAVTLSAPAKVNLFLGVGGTRPDGYHAVTTVLHTLELADEIHIAEAPELTLTCTADLCIPAEKNLAWRAATSLGEAFGRRAEVAIELRKMVPHGAGLGGGSSDAAAVIAGLATLWGESHLDPRCLNVARSLGSDVPFFLLGGAALMTGRGDVFERHLPAMDTPVVLVKPADPVSTAEAYRTFDASPEPPGVPDPVVAALKAHDAAALGGALSNNLAAVAQTLVPTVGEALAFLSAAGDTLGACVAGSGSAVFALCPDDAVAERIADEATAHGWWSAATRLSASGVEVTE